MRIIQCLILTTLLSFFYSCSDDEASGPEKDRFTGNYLIESEHISQIHTFYDSVGNVIGMGLDTNIYSNEKLSITEGTTSDTMVIDGLINSFFSGNRTVAKGGLLNDSIQIVYEQSNPPLSNDFIRGKIWLTEDSIFLDYYWDKSDIWSSGAFPEKGHVKASGIKNR